MVVMPKSEQSNSMKIRRDNCEQPAVELISC
jgi:hypothetical protein